MRHAERLSSQTSSRVAGARTKGRVPRRAATVIAGQTSVRPGVMGKHRRGFRLACATATDKRRLRVPR